MRVIETGQDTEVMVDGRRMLMLGSNAYLELTTHPLVKARAAAAVQQYGTGCAGSRFLNGTLPIHLELERRLADLVGKPAALVFPTGFQTNTGVVASLVHQGEYIIVDKYIHACILDGCTLSQGTLVRFNHNDMADLEEKLARVPRQANKLIITDGIFSMEGDLCDLPRIVQLARRYGAQVMVDDAHGIGVIGPGGCGTAAHFGLTGEVDLIMGTFSKSLAAIGGFIAGPRAGDQLPHAHGPPLRVLRLRLARQRGRGAGGPGRHGRRAGAPAAAVGERPLPQAGFPGAGVRHGQVRVPHHPHRGGGLGPLPGSLAVPPGGGHLREPGVAAGGAARTLHDPHLRHRRAHPRAAQLGPGALRQGRPSFRHCACGTAMTLPLEVRPVLDKSDLEAFIRFPFRLHAREPHWVPPLLMERREFYHPAKNPVYEYAQVRLFAALRGGAGGGHRGGGAQ